MIRLQFVPGFSAEVTPEQVSTTGQLALLNPGRLVSRFTPAGPVLITEDGPLIDEEMYLVAAPPTGGYPPISDFQRSVSKLP